MSADRRNQLLVDELKAAVGEDAVERADIDVDRAVERRRPGLSGAFQSARLLLLVVGGALVVTGVIASLALDNWIFFAVAILAHALFTFVVIGSALAMTTETEKPSPTAEAELQEEGVRDPSGALNDLVEQVAGEEEGSRTKRLVGEQADETDPQDTDPPNAAARQQASATPASENTRTPGNRSR